jgi:hypothetical protein
MTSAVRNDSLESASSATLKGACRKINEPRITHGFVGVAIFAISAFSAVKCRCFPGNSMTWRPNITAVPTDGVAEK